MTKVKTKVKQHPAVRGLKVGMQEFACTPIFGNFTAS